MTPLLPATSIWGAVRWMSGALVAFTLIAIAGRGAARTLSAMDIVFWRCWSSFALVLTLAGLAGRGFARFRSRRLPLHVARSVVHLAATWCWVFALPLIPLAELVAIEFTAPLWTALIAALVLGERMTVVRVLAVVLGFIGVVVVVRPTGLSSLGPGTLAAAAAAICFGCHYAMTKRLTAADSAFTLLFWMTLLQAVWSTVLALPTLQAPGAEAAAWVLAMSVIGLVAHFSLSRAFAYADAVVVAPLDFLRLPASAVVGWAIYGEELAAAVALGALLVVAANALNIWGERRGRGR